MKLAVLGDPVAHSRSPILHEGFLREAGLAGTYEAIRVPAGTLEGRLAELRRDGYTGFNVTTPLKEEAFGLCTRTDATARFAGAVNTLRFDEADLAGTNTDGPGAVAALRGAVAGSLAEASVLLLGAGATARAVALALTASAARVVLWARREETARALAGSLAREGRAGAELLAGSSSAGGEAVFDAVFSTLPPEATLPGPLARRVRDAALLVDANYGSRATLARSLGRTAPSIDGSTMLAAQARASFDWWCAASPSGRVRIP